MFRWFYADEAERCKHVRSVTPDHVKQGIDKQVGTVEDTWHFSVIMPKPLKGNERVAISGNCDSLGNWQLGDTVLMELDPKTKRYTADVIIPRDRDVEYRYAIVAIEVNPLYGNPCLRTIARKWETHFEPRYVRYCQNKLVIEEDVFGTKNEEHNVDQGWLTSEVYIQFRFFNCPLLEGKNMRPRPMFIRVTPRYAFTKQAECDKLERSSSHTINSDCVCGDFPSRTYAFSDVVNIGDRDDTFKPQPQYGSRCGPDDLTMFQLTLGDFDNTAYLFDIFTYRLKACYDEPPCHYAYGYLCASQLQGSEGRVDIKLTCASTFRPLGTLSIDYMIFRNTYGLECDLSRTYAHYWNPRRNGIGIGHRGCGLSYRLDGGIMRENTIYSLWQAGEHGTEIIEFDVMLTKDQIPIVYHDFMLNLCLKPIDSIEEVLNERDVFAFPMTDFNLKDLIAKGTRIKKCFIALPVSKFTLEELRKLKVLRYAVDKHVAPSCWSWERLKMQHPFPTLEEVFERIPKNVGFNIEIKWSQRDVNGIYEEQFKPDIDRNDYVDAILEVVYKKAQRRIIFFSCFDVDICAMLRFKQNYYPVLLLYDNDFLDVRVRNFEAAITTAHVMRLLGVSARDTNIFEESTAAHILHNLKMILFAWGPLCNWSENRKVLGYYDVNAIIYDRIDQHENVGVQLKRNVFIMEGEWNQQQIRQIIDSELIKRNIKLDDELPF